jgi:hypothetical protein
MSIADHKALTLRIFDTFNTHDAAATAALFAPNAVLRDIAVPQPVVGRAQIAGVFAEWTISGTHQGKLMGIPASGRAVTIAGVSIIRFREGAPVEDTRVWDLAGLLRQIGLLPRRYDG